MDSMIDYGGLVVSKVALQLQSPGSGLGSGLGSMCMEFACFLCAWMDECMDGRYFMKMPETPMKQSAFIQL